MFDVKYKEVIHKSIMSMLVIMMLAFLSTYVVFFGQYFDSSADGLFHMSRFESVYQSFAAGQWPSRFNFIGFDNQGSVISGMYPWITSLIFILPRFIAEPFTALAIGFFIMNLLTMIFTWLLMRRLTNQRLLQWLGILLYQFNGYHFIVMYSRVAIGEAIGYMVLPLVLLGLIDIWHQRKWGWVTLGIAMAIVANGHVLSLILCTMMVVVFELYRLMTKKMSWSEIWQLVKGAMLAVVLAGYSLFTIFQIVTQNTLTPPTVRWNTMTPLNYIIVTATNDFKEYRDTTMGLVIGVLLILFLVLALKQKEGRWRRWIIAANVVLMGCFNFIYWPGMVNTPLGTIQFSMRFLMFSGLFLAVGIVMYYQEHALTNKRRHWVIITMVAVTLGSLIGMIQHDRKNYDYLKRVTPSTYANWISCNHSRDYVVLDDKFKRRDHDISTEQGRKALNSATMYDPKIRQKFTYKGSTFDSVAWAQETKMTGMTKLPVVGYKGVKYKVLVNGKEVKFECKEGHLFVPLTKGHNDIAVSAR